MMFEASVEIPGVAGGAISTAAADLNLDGVPDLVTVATRNSLDPHFRIHSLGTEGHWESHDVLSSVEIGQRANRFGGDSILVDVNGDNYPDILLPESSNGAGPAKLSWFENPASNQLIGEWTEHVIGNWDGSTGPERPAHMSEVFAGDLDGDADIDLVTRDVNNGLHILESDGLGGFERHYLPVNPREGLDLFDPDQDGDLDILINGVWLEAPDPGDGPVEWANLADVGNYEFHSLQGTGSTVLPWYPGENNSVTQENYASKVIAVDVNGDGLDDVVISNAEELNNLSIDEKPKGIAVFLAGNTEGTAWTEVVPLAEGRQLHTLEAVDLDYDGDIDLVSGVSPVGQGAELAEVFALLNGGDGTEWTRLPIENVSIYSGITIDIDGDGDEDIVGPENWRNGKLRFFKSNASELLFAKAGDYNCDGIVNHADLVTWQQSFGSAVELASTQADGDGSGKIAGGDFLFWQKKLAEQASLAELVNEVPEPSNLCLTFVLALHYAVFPRFKDQR